MSTNGEYRRIGKVSKPHGIRGAFMVFLESDFPDWLLTRKRIFAEINGSIVPWQVTSARMQRDRLVLQVAEISDRNRVEELRQTSLFVTEEEAQAAISDTDYFYNSDLIGMKVFEDGQEIGEVRDVIEMPAQNLLEISSEDGVFHLPFVADLVLDVDLDARVMAVKVPVGLREINQKKTT